MESYCGSDFHFSTMGDFGDLFVCLLLIFKVSLKEKKGNFFAIKKLDCLFIAELKDYI